jgi:hypothetical protein
MRWLIGIVVVVVGGVLAHRLFQRTRSQATGEVPAPDGPVRLAPDHLSEVAGWATQVDLTCGIPSDAAARGVAYQNAINEVQHTVSPDDLKRGQHARGLYATNNGEISFAANLPGSLLAGPVQAGARYRVVARLSNAADRVVADAVPDRRGLALSMVGPDGKSQDLLFTTGASAFLAQNADEAMAAADVSAARADGLPATGRAFARFVFRIGPLDAARLLLAAQTTTDTGKSIAGQMMFGRTPYTLGDHVVKLRLVPMQSGEPLLDPDLGKDMAAQRERGDVSYRLDAMDGSIAMEDARRGDGPWVPIGRLRFPKQDADEARDANLLAEIETRRFSPFQRWDDDDDRALLPVGSVNWARKFVYDASAKLRGSIGPAADCRCLAAAPTTDAAPRDAATPP